MNVASILASSGIPASELWLFLVFAVAFAVVGFYASRSHLRNYGVTPWHLPSVLWGLLFFLSLMVGGLLFLIARVTTRPRLPDMSGVPGGGRSPSGWPTPASGGYGRAPVAGVASVPPSAVVAPGVVEPGPPLEPREWKPDPSGRHQLRYFDGRGLTEHVSDDGKITIDPL